MSIQFLSFLFSCFYFLSLQAAENKPKKHIDNLDQLRQEVAHRHDKHVKFTEVTTRKGPRIEGDPNQKKEIKEKS